MENRLIIDTSNEVSKGSRADQYWKEEGFDDFVQFIRPNLILPKVLNDASNTAEIMKRFSLNGFNFGNWVTNEDRHNYLGGIVVSLYDLNKILDFNYNLGFGVLSVAFGARGRGKALAHYEPGNKIINITRYNDGEEYKAARFIATGGMGALAHEYAHFLDYFSGEFLDKSDTLFALTGGSITSRNRTNESGEMRVICDDILELIVWETPDKQSNYYKRLIKFLERTDDAGDYYVRRNELFARWFEAWIGYELDNLNVTNKLLTQQKYSSFIYPTFCEIELVAPLFHKLCKLIKKKIK